MVALLVAVALASPRAALLLLGALLLAALADAALTTSPLSVVVTRALPASVPLGETADVH